MDPGRSYVPNEGITDSGRSYVPNAGITDTGRRDGADEGNTDTGRTYVAYEGYVKISDPNFFFLPDSSTCTLLGEGDSMGFGVKSPVPVNVYVTNSADFVTYLFDDGFRYDPNTAAKNVLEHTGVLSSPTADWYHVIVETTQPSMGSLPRDEQAYVKILVFYTHPPEYYQQIQQQGEIRREAAVTIQAGKTLGRY